ncbi:PREDICTED: glutaredoxin 3 [Nicrophorus vespilloides]|uniref:Glutaredoxin 3 n=1 Tax=Nicrophorus vespilloides TaxID=110193 RepID=A0ABM1N9W3_NICVS|nr:PREDICTED: glutaredoxin 3 [Nicrophorus vespilloides]
MPELINDAKTFREKIKSANLTVIHFSADFAEQCKDIDNLLDTIAKDKTKYGSVQFCKCIAEELSDISLENKIDSVPTLLFYKFHEVVGRVDGANPAEITKKLAELANAPDTLQDRLKQLINLSKVMLFMKGDRVQPKCGFSRQIIQILDDLKIEYKTFDILTNEAVRQGLKEYSDWPTYPQLYCNGNLVGGLDVVKELRESDELIGVLNE